MNIYKSCDFASTVNDWESGLGDKGYQGAPKLLTPFKRRKRCRLSEEEEAVNALIASIRILIERVMGRFKNSAALATKWRGNIDDHLKLFVVQGQTVNLCIDVMPLVKTPHHLLEIGAEP